MTATPSREDVRRHLESTRITGDVATSREDNLLKYGLFASRLPKALFGLEPHDSWALGDVLTLMADRVGVSADPGYLRGPDRIDTTRTLDALDAMAKELRDVAAPGARVVVATGHPAGLLPVYLAVAAALRAAGARVLTPAAGRSYPTVSRAGPAHREIRYVEDVAVVSSRGELNHTHSPQGMRLILDSLAAQGEPLPDLVLADHGWAGAAGQAGIRTVGFADSNDPALFVGEAEGKLAVVVPLDDNVAPHLYQPLTAYLLAAAGLTRPGQPSAE